MKNKHFSISYKWTIILVGLVMALLAIGLVINRLFFYDYYLNKEKESIYNFAESLDAVYDDNDKANELIDRFVLKKQLSVQIIDDVSQYKFSFGMMMRSNSGGKSSKASSGITLTNEIKRILDEEGYHFFTFEHNVFKTKLLGLLYVMQDGDVLLITLPFEELDTTANVAIEFNIIIAIVLLSIGMIVIMLLAKRMTKPIIQLSDMTKKMSELDFSVSFKGHSKDEIGQLGDNINQMSHALETTLIELKEANHQLMDDLAEKEKLVQMRKSFIGNISHELKTPIALIMSYSEGLRDNHPMDDEKKDYYLNVISKEADQMDHLVRDLLDLTELEYDAFKLNKSTFDLSSLIDEILDRYILLISNKQLKINTNKEDIVMVKADKKRLEQAITNLILNALEYTPEKGELQINLTSDQTMTCFELANSGSHLPEGHLKDIWTSFYKSEEKRDRRIGGSGIGLSIVRAVIEKHHGSYGAQNTERGVSFWFKIEK